ncbi:MAG: bifunctional folylpolyglutamate synthase/dihydrofolate synthase [Flavobacteriaceae bacterium]|nr:bifunctional folylpolyglutamate synthase/dihydrofolate synthase [Flavobacteriaceae bacterium]MBT3872198.1 bifunctional folylpolyglutamate synthase/dihydrofolate synthase [Flavobacteriaceae bacterium]MBT3920347.1 bifunctional folylpolyglutamate synthase/dihydrofolate synthase [Flavobacteriaceae bacterium]MBT6705791.1 bifunctional folylpolyglutamate synthase/dihydrofolate synthase [Flavobacteriaceae bacterium]
MNYRETISWLFNKLPMYQRVGAAAYKVDVSNTLKLMAHLKDPQNSFKTVHVAGTNGKGSTSHMLASVLQDAGYKVGLYTSPHLKDFRERIKLNGKMMPEQKVVDFIESHRSFFEENQLSFFEMTVGLAFDYFKNEKVDIAIIEVGLGGRLDSTNVINPEVSVITNIGLDHTQFLGTTLAEIASEKAGIIKPKIPVVIGETKPETKSVFLHKARKEKSPILFVEAEAVPEFKTDLLGSYQIKNCKTAHATLGVLEQKGWDISNKNIENGFLNVAKNTGLQGRWQVLNTSPKVICDTAHNIEGLSLVLNQLKKENFDQLHIVLGVVADKNLDAILPLFPRNATYYFCKPAVVRGLAVAKLQQKARGYELIGKSYVTVREAYKSAMTAAKAKDLIFIGGSTFVVAEVL